MNLDKVKLVREDPDSFVVRDEDGKDFTVAKHGLSGVFVAKIRQHFAKGGTVLDDPGYPTFVIDLDGDGVPDPLTNVIEGVENLPPPAMSPSVRMRAQQMEQPGVSMPPVEQTMGVPDFPMDPEVPAAEVPYRVERPRRSVVPPAVKPYVHEWGDRPQGPEPSQEQVERDAEAEVAEIQRLQTPNAPPGAPQMMPSHEPMGKPQQSAASAGTRAPQVAASPAVEGPRQPSRLESDEAEIDSNYRMQEEAVRAKAAVEGEIARDQLQVQQHYRDESQRIVGTFNDRILESQNRADTAFQAYMNGEVDPNRIWKEGGTRRKIVAAVAILLGGFGNSVKRGGPNPAMAVIDKAIERDVEAQKDNLAKGAYAVNYYLRQGESLTNAKQLAVADLKDMAAAELQMASLKHGSDLAQTIAQSEIASLREQARGARVSAYSQSMQTRLHEAQIRSAEADTLLKQAGLLRIRAEAKALEQRQAMMEKLVAQGGRIPDEMLPEDQRKRRVEIPGIPVNPATGMPPLARSEDAAKKVNEAMQQAAEFDSILNQVQEQRFGVEGRGPSDKGGKKMPGKTGPGAKGRAWFPDILTGDSERQTSEALYGALLGPLRTLMGLGVLNKSDYEILATRIPKVGSKYKTDAQIQSMIDILRHDLDAKVQSYLRQYVDGGTDLFPME